MEQDRERRWRDQAGRRDWERTWSRNQPVVYGSFSGKGPRGYFHGGSELRIGRGDEERYE